jgi:hypothetical protein
VSEGATINLQHELWIDLATLFGNDTICVKQLGHRMQLIDVSCDDPEILKTNIKAKVVP